MRDGLVTTDPTAGIEVALGHAEVNHLTLAELLAVLDATRTTFDKALLGLMGLRKGEALSLRVQDVDLYRHELSVRTSGAATDTTKTRASRRALPIPALLETWLDELVTGRPLDQWAFESSRKPGQPVDPTYPGNKLRLAIATANLTRQDKIKTIRPHDLRHTFASITLAENRSDLMAVSRAMGHARPSITMNHYGHLAPRGIETLFQGLDQAIDIREDR